MTDVLYLSAEEVAALVTPGDLLDAQRRALVMLSQGAASVPDRGTAHAPGSMLESMPGYLPGLGYGAKLTSFTPGNAARGLPLHFGLLALFDPATGTPLAVISADALTAGRTAAVTAVAADVLARPDARVLAVIGSGVQAAAHLEYLPLVRDFAEVRIGARNPAAAQALTLRYPRAGLAADVRAAVREADVICCCTSATEPVLDASWLAPGTNIISVGMGSDKPLVTPDDTKAKKAKNRRYEIQVRL